MSDARDLRHQNWPDPPEDAWDALAHTLDVFAGTPDGDFAVLATGNVYGDGVRTGLTWGDLREILKDIP